MQINSDCEVKKLTERIVDKIDPVIKNRNNIIKKHLTLKINRYPNPENLNFDRLACFEQCYVVRKSRFVNMNPITLIDCPAVLDYAFIYNDRIYYAKDH